MDKWEYLTITVTNRDDGNIDYIIQRDNPGDSHSPQDGIDAFFNVTKEDCASRLNALKEEGWEPVSAHVRENGELHQFQRLIRTKVEE